MQMFSQSATQAIQDFVENLRMPRVDPAPDGSYSFAFQRAGLLSFSSSADGKRAIMSLKKGIDHTPTAADLSRFLSLAQRDPITQMPISAGMAGGGFILAMNIPDKAFNLQNIELCLDRLIALLADAP